jgi:hypothetical protein
MTPEEFTALVREMRRWQKAFFISPKGSHARYEALKRSKELEEQVDTYLTPPAAPVQEQGNLFDQEKSM